MSRLLLFAQYCEAEYTIKKFNAIPDLSSIRHVHSEGMIPTFYQYSSGYIALSNIGISSAMMTVAKYAHLIDEVWNLGFAGCLNNEYSLGSIREITQVEKYIPSLNELDSRSRFLTTSIHPPFFLTQDSEHVKLISSDFPIHDNALRSKLSLDHHLVDMEGYGIVSACRFFNKKCKLFKIISDFCSPEGRAFINNNKKQFSEKLSKLIN